MPANRKIVRYNPNSQNIGKATTIDKKAANKLKSLNKINSSNLKTYAIQVHIKHSAISVITAMALFKKRGSDKKVLTNSNIF